MSRTPDDSIKQTPISSCDLPVCWKRNLMISCMLGLLGFAAVVAGIDPLKNVAGFGAGPGITIDESFNVQQGVVHLSVIKDYGPLLLLPDSIQDYYGSEYHLPDHPPLGRLWIGLWHDVVNAMFSPDPQNFPFKIVAGRFGSAAAFGLTLALMTFVMTRWFGHVAGLSSGLAYFLMPRVFGHAHLASLETVLNLTYTASILCIAQYWMKPDPPKLKVAALTGIVFGLALLTKIQAVFLPVTLGLWAVIRWPKSCWLPCLIWGVVGVVVFFVGWPWLWLDPVGHMMDYFASSTERATLHVYYMGTRYADTEAPWHYPWMMFAITMPLPLLILGGIGLKSVVSDLRIRLIAIAALFPLLVFSLPVAKYDGIRLFLVACPFWAMLAGFGYGQVHQWMRARIPVWSQGLVVLLLVLYQVGMLWAYHPLHLSYYNMSVAGIYGAERLGFEVSYWGDSLTSEFWERVAAVDNPYPTTLYPVLHQFQLQDLEKQSSGNIRVVTSDSFKQEDLVRNHAAQPDSEWTGFNVIVFHRKADLHPELVSVLDERMEKPVEVTRFGVPLATMYVPRD